MHKLGMQQTIKVAKQTGTHRQSWMQIMQAETEQTYLIIVILTQTKLMCQLIFIPVATKKLTKEQVRSSEREYSMN